MKACHCTAQLQHSIVKQAHHAVIALLGVDIIFGRHKLSFATCKRRLLPLMAAGPAGWF